MVECLLCLALFGLTIAVGGAELFNLFKVKGDLGALILGVLLVAFASAGPLGIKLTAAAGGDVPFAIEHGRDEQALCRELGISSATFYQWRSKYGGLEVSEAKRLKALEAENAKLKKMLAEQMMDVATLKEMLGKNF